MQFLDRLKISQRLYVIVIFIILAFISIAGIFHYTQNIYEKSDNSEKHYSLISKAVLDVSNGISKSRQSEAEFLLNLDENQLTQHEKSLSEVYYILEELKSHEIDNEQIKLTQNVINILKHYEINFNEVAALKIRNGVNHNLGLLGSLRESVHKIEHVVNEKNAVRLAHSMLMMRRHEKDFITRNLSIYIDKINQEYKAFMSLLNESKLSPQEKNIIIPLADDYLEKFLTLVDGINEIKLKENDFLVAVQSIAPELARLQERTYQLSSQAKEDHKATINEITFMFYALLISLVFILIPLVLWIIRSINYSTKHAITMFQKIASGDAQLTQRLDESGKDEMAELSRWFNIIMDKLQIMVEDISKMAEQLTEASVRAQSAKDITTGEIQTQVREIGNITQDIESVSLSFQQLAENAHLASDQASETDKTANQGKKDAKETIDVIEQLAINIEQAGESVRELEEYSQSINSVIAMINGIAEQTNLLALNAAIEAARAGEAGRGFAVVADEVRVLSQRTTASTEEIKKTIEALQRGTRNAVDIMSQSKEKASSSVAQVKITGESLDSIAIAVSNIATLNAAMSTSASSQSEATIHINKNIQIVNTATNRLANSAQQTMSDSGDISQIAALLQTMSTQFGKSNQNNPTAPSSSTNKDSVELF